MKVYLQYYNFPFSECYHSWHITYENKTSSWAGDGYVIIQADIKPNYKSLIDCLIENRIINMMELSYLQSINFETHLTKQLQKTYNILSITSHFCNNKHHYSITKRGYSMLEAGFGGNTNCCEKAIYKIKKEICYNLPNIEKEFINYLINNNL